MQTRTKLISAACSLAMAMAVGAVQAAELTADQMDTITAGAAAAAATSAGNTAVAVASSQSGGVYQVTGNVVNASGVVDTTPVVNTVTAGAGAYAGAP